jgi:hypothetical protein
VEDNAAWVGLTRGVASQASVGPGINGALGPVIPTILGLLHEFQRAGIPTYNATFSAYALVVFCIPIVVASLLVGKIGFKPLAAAAFVLMLIAWAYRVPFLLFASYGHLSAIRAVLFLIGLVVFFMRARKSTATLFVGMGLALAVGTVWFSIAALGMGAAGAVLVITWSGIGRYARALGIAGFVVVTYVLVRQLPVSAGDNPAIPHETFSSLYAAQGGTASIDATLFVVILIGVAGLSWLGARFGRELSRTSTLAICGVLYIGAVYVGAYALRVGVGYGPTKVAFVVGSVVLVLLLSAVPRFVLPLASSSESLRCWEWVQSSTAERATLHPGRGLEIRRHRLGLCRLRRPSNKWARHQLLPLLASEAGSGLRIYALAGVRRSRLEATARISVTDWQSPMMRTRRKLWVQPSRTGRLGAAM